jgi:hypothetical protein
MAVAATLAVIELVVDKIPYLTARGQRAHRHPARIAAIAASDRQMPTAPPRHSRQRTALVAIVSHLTKSGIRSVNSSPEPVTNIGVSASEDVVVVTVAVLAWQHRGSRPGSFS